MWKLPGVKDSAEDEGAGGQGPGRAGPPDQRRNRANDASDPSIGHRYPFHRCVNTGNELRNAVMNKE